MSSEVSSYSSEDEGGLELGLGLTIGGCVKPNKARIFLTAKDFPCVSVSGTKRNADSVSNSSNHHSHSQPASSPPRLSQVVGWPPIRASRMYSLVNQAKTQRSEDNNNKLVVCCDKENPKEPFNKNTNNNNNNKEQGNNNLGFVKVNIDGIAIGRKVDLNSHTCYDSLAKTLQDMFFRPGMTVDLNGSSGETKEQGKPRTTSKLLDGSSEFVLTYEDKDGDWMLVGDVPWRMFLGSVKRLRIMRTSEATGLAPRFHQRNERQRMKPI